MRSKIAALASDSIIYGLGQAATKSIYLILVPALTRAFTTTEYGLVEVTNLLVTLVYMVALVGMDSAFAYHYYRIDDRFAARQLTSTAVLGRVGFNVVAAALLAVGAPLLGVIEAGARPHTALVMLAACTLPGAAAVAAIQDVLRVTFRPVSYAVFTSTNVLANGLATLALVFVAHAGPSGVFLGRLLADGASTIVGLWLVRHSLTRHVSRADLARLARFGAPLIATSLSYWFVAYVDRYVLGTARGLDEVGVYSVAAKLAGVVTFFVSAFTLAWGPYCYALAHHPEVRRTMARVLNLYVLGAGLLAAALSLFAREILTLATTRAYWGGWAVVGLLAFGNAAYGAYYVAGMAVNMAGRTRHLGWTSALGAVVAIALSLALVGRWGMSGVAVGTLTGYVVAVSAVAIVGQRVFPLPVRWGRLFLFLAALGVVVLLGTRTPSGTLPPAAAALAKVLALVALSALAFPLGLYSRSDVREAIASARRFVHTMRVRAALEET